MASNPATLVMVSDSATFNTALLRIAIWLVPLCVVVVSAIYEYLSERRFPPIFPLITVTTIGQALTLMLINLLTERVSPSTEQVISPVFGIAGTLLICLLPIMFAQLFIVAVLRGRTDRYLRQLLSPNTVTTPDTTAQTTSDGTDGTDNVTNPTPPSDSTPLTSNPRGISMNSGECLDLLLLQDIAREMIDVDTDPRPSFLSENKAYGRELFRRLADIALKDYHITEDKLKLPQLPFAEQFPFLSQHLRKLPFLNNLPAQPKQPNQLKQLHVGSFGCAYRVLGWLALFAYAITLFIFLFFST